MSKLKYVSVHELEFNDAEIMQLIKDDDREALLLLPMKLGFCHESWRFIQDVCKTLSEHPDETIRANSFYGFQYTAMNLGRLEKNIIKPILLRGLKDESSLVREQAQYSIEEINRFMNWRIASAKMNKEKERKYYQKFQ